MAEELESDPREALKGIPAAVVVFYAAWCAECKSSEQYEDRLAEEFKGKAAFFRMDATELEEIADRYGIERYPTYLFFRKGKPQRGMLVEPVALGEARNWLEIAIRRR